MSELAAKQRLRRARERIAYRLSRQGFEVFYDCKDPCRLMAVKRGRTRIIHIDPDEKSQPRNLVK